MIYSLEIANKLDRSLDVAMVFIGIVSSWAVLSQVADILAIVVLMVNLLYVLSKMKRDINMNYRNSVKRFIGQLLRKNTRYDREQ